MHWLGLVVIIVIAGVVAMVLLQRIYDAQQKLAALHDDLRRNDLKLQNELSRLEARSTPAQSEVETRAAQTSAAEAIETRKIQEEEKP